MQSAVESQVFHDVFAPPKQFDDVIVHLRRDDDVHEQYEQRSIHC